MSYDLLVFEPSVPPDNPDSFMAWYRALTEWSEGHNYDDPTNTTPLLQSWYRDMIGTFPAMNGPDGAGDDELTNAVTDYACARAAIYAAFSWSEAERANKAALAQAQKHSLGFWDVSLSQEVWGPLATGGYGVWFRVA